MNKHFRLMCSIIILCAMAFLVYGQTKAALTDKQVIEQVVIRLKTTTLTFRDYEILNINKLVNVSRHQNGASIYFSAYDDNGVWLTDSFETITNKRGLRYPVGISFEFVNPPNYDSDWSDKIGPFMKQTNRKFSNKIPLVNFKQKDLIATFEYADGSKVIFDVYYAAIRYELLWWRKELADPRFYDPNDR
ncbi:MAG: hypothetical protein FWB85_00130 [Chitinispirillia bacterium]|nr:hypothetical protein [Chitinispirillia bacterium]MCL2240916.1 hypothetical protein [Chitinispirillia bacterium]